MQVIILATDEQRKLPPLTDTLPTPMLPIVDRPAMATAVEIVARAGYKQVLISLYERGGRIAAYFGSGRRWGIDIKYVTQRQSWGSAGALRWAGGLLGETFLVLPGDSVCDLDIDAALRFHQAHGGAATVILHSPRAAASAPTAQADAEGRILSIGPKVAEDEPQLTGAFIFEPSVLRHIPQGDSYDVANDLLPSLISAGEAVYGHMTTGYWNPLDSLAAYQEAQQVYLYSAYHLEAPEQATGGPAERVRFPSLEARPIAPGVWVGRDHSIHPAMKLAAPVYIGHNSWIGREVELGAGTVLGSNVVIDDEATLSDSTVLSNTYIGQLVRVEGKVVTADSICDPTTGATTRVVDPFLISRVGAAAEGRSPIRRMASTVAAIGLIVLLGPLFLVAGLIALLASGGQPLVRSPRVGQQVGGANGSLRTFQLVNYRTRRANGSFIPGGRLLERWDLHRLPELFNVLSGDMGLVGVKPLRPEEAARLTEEWHQQRHEAPAGITGLWYLQTDADSDLDTVIVTDVYYTATRSWRGDMLLLLRTPGAWLHRHSGQGGRAYRMKADNVGGM
ncbi:MAG: nucleotidyl transferase [Chloroflexales bacterium]|nr:nucleotidyl transferase [Chloroflexales bacterium]